jgi:hypothetical protein
MVNNIIFNLYWLFVLYKNKDLIYLGLLFYL